MIEAALATYSFPIGETQSPALIAVPASVLDEILSEVQALRDQVASQGEDITALRQQLNALEASHITEVDWLSVDIAHDRQRISKLESSNVKCENDRPRPQGAKTATRIEKLKSILKRCGGSRTFAQLQKDLGLSPSQFTRLTKALDGRSFEVFRRAGGKRGEKVLRLKVRIMDPVVLT
jgi:hypothetical protein